MYITICAFLWSIWSCKPPDTTLKLEGLWLGNYQHELYEFPLPIIWFFSNDSLMTEWKRREQKDFEWLLSGDVLLIDTMEYVVQNFTKNQIVLERETVIVFDKIDTTRKEKNLDFLEQYAWRKKERKSRKSQKKDLYTEEIHRFKDDKIWIQRTYWYDQLQLGQEIEMRCGKIERFKEYPLIVEAGYWDTCDSLYAPLQYVTDLDKHSYTVLTAKGKKMREITYEATDLFEVSDSAFYVCSQSVGAYYGVNISYKGEKKAVKDFVFNALKNQQFGTESGYIMIRFVINCAGQLGNFEIEQTDLNFNTIKFDKQLIKRLFLLTKSLTDWKIGKNEEGEHIDGRKFFTYKIENGRLKAILP